MTLWVSASQMLFLTSAATVGPAALLMKNCW